MEHLVNRRVATKVVQKLSEQGLDNTSLADHLEMSEATLVRRLTSKSGFSIAELWNAAEFLRCPLSDLLPMADPPHSNADDTRQSA